MDGGDGKDACSAENCPCGCVDGKCPKKWCSAQVLESGKSCEKPHQGKYLGKTAKTPEECQQKAEAEGCDSFMFSAKRPHWGCRCCKGNSNNKSSWWSIYNTNPDKFADMKAQLD